LAYRAAAAADLHRSVGKSLDTLGQLPALNFELRKRSREHH
jgi:hypothetical protein